MDPQDILDRLERGELDFAGALARFDGEVGESSRAPASPPSRAPSGKLRLTAPDVVDERSAPAPARVRLEAVDPSRTAPSDPEVRLFPRDGRAVVALTVPESGIVLVRLQDRERANMFSPELLRGLRHAFAEIEAMTAARVVIVTGIDTWFCCGGAPEDLARMRDGRASFLDIDGFRLLLDCSLPTIAAMQGHSLGGGLTFGLYADITLLADSAYYSANFMEHELTPGVGTTYILPRKLGVVLGSEMMFTAQRYQGRELEARGVPLEVLNKEQVLARAFALARELAKMPLRQLALLKRHLVEDARRELPGVLREEDRIHARCFPRSTTSAARSLEGAHRAIAVERSDGLIWITLDRARAGNSIDDRLLDELHAALDEVEQDTAVKVVVLRGQPGVFCTGLDFAAGAAADASTAARVTSRFQTLLSRMSTISKIVVALVDGQVLAGGVGLVAASDFVLATPRSSFGLTEALWGLLPAVVLPFLIRRTGFGPAYAMALGTESVGAEAARAMRLVDEVLDGDQDGRRVVEHKARRLARIDANTIAELKAYFRELWIVDETTERLALSEINRLLADPRIRARMKDFAETGTLP